MMRLRTGLTSLARTGLAALALAALGCGGAAQLEAPVTGSVAVSSQAAMDLQRRTTGFYLRLADRRFNSLETYHDFIMRGHFRTPELFLDYYADLAESLAEAHFERSSPVGVEVGEFLFEDALSARVEVRFIGGDDRPLRPGHVDVVRIDHWEWADGTWWIQPGRTAANPVP
jgi:hypothetical protein